ncbi:porin [Mycoplana rhizolycopersici]|uniref:Porin n=1 Tax=Mycoplana rhizolycopersici TaxID=2746702 RepID=A0ABX2QAR6_9HYPH|nr:porin [Rhizobium rhizolycopersici]NVP54268.1 porin [Rhizobium rhizolycopersici]
MNIKSLLLGSAAALAAVSGAQAADAIVAAEPEPMEYVRVCDAFGTGYFYIPGTETCLKIGGYIRVEWKGGDVLGQDTYGFDDEGRFAFGGGDSWNTRTRATVKFSTATDTEYGALKTYAEVEFQKDNNNGGSTNLAHGYIEFAGFLVGFTDSLFAGGYIGGGFSNNDYIYVNYGDTARNQIRYTYGDTSAGFTFTAAVEDSSDANELNADTYVPNVVGGVGYSGGGFQAFLVGGYDGVVEEGAIKGRINATFGAFSAYVMAGWNTDGDQLNDYAQWYGDWAVWLGAKYQATEKLAIYGDLNFMDQGVGFDTDTAKVEASLGLDYAVVPGFKIRPEVSYVSDFSDIAGGEANDWGGMIRFQRDF